MNSSKIKQIIPIWLLDLLRKKRYKKSSSVHLNQTPKEVFTNIYTVNGWGSQESVSGQGSTLEMSQYAINMLNSIVEEYSITSILDLPCGDFNWMKKVKLDQINYLGADIVEELINQNKKQYTTHQVNFEVLDLLKDDLPKVDLILVRDCFVHFAYDDFQKAMENIKLSGSKYLLTTTFISASINYDITTGDWRPINLQKPPFSFPNPIKVEKEFVHPNYEKEGRGKALGLWSIKDL